MHRLAKISFWTALVLFALAGSSWSERPPYALPSNGIITDNSYTVEELVQDVFVNGACNTITNIQAIGNEEGIGYFEDGASSIGMERGVILSTGPTENAHGPNDYTDLSGNFNDTNGDPDLNLMATGAVKDAVGIEFDFTPLDSTVAFRYVFASEEYCEFVGSIYNDVFGFFISGPGINGSFSDNAENVAILPGTSDYVSINSVNYQDNAQLYVHNELATDANVCDISIPSGAYHPFIEYDGFTTRLTAVLKLIPCETYHIRLVVSDVGDNFFDSAVFLEAESFNLGGEVKVSAGTGATPQDPALEGCSGNYFKFERAPDTDDSFPLSVNYLISSSSTAEEGVDFTSLPGSITIPAHQNYVALPVELINDGLVEPLEQIDLKLDIPCACYSDSTTMYITDSPGFDLTVADVAVCENSTNIMPAQIEGGTGGFTYQWSTGAGSNAITVSADNTGPYFLTVTDACGNTEVDSAYTFTTPPPTAVLSGYGQICQGDTAWLNVDLQGTPPWQLGYQVAGQQFDVQQILQSPFQLPAVLQGTHELTWVADSGCEGEASGTALVEVNTINVSATTQDATCSGVADGQITATLNGGTPPYDWFWLDTPAPDLQRKDLSPGSYVILVTDDSGCEAEATFTISSPPPLEPLEFDCEAIASGAIDARPTGGTPPYLFSIDGAPFGGAELLDQLTAGEEYTISILDAMDCEVEQDIRWPATYEQLVNLPATMEINLGQPDTIRPVFNIPLSLIASIRWTPSIGLSCFDCPFPEVNITQPQTYTLRVVDVYGCSIEVSISITLDESIDIFIPTAFSPNGDQVNDQLNVYANAHQVAKVLTFRVFDRWGGLMFEARDFPPNSERLGWDGTFRGQPMDPGVYTYMAILELTTGTRKTIGGHALLMR
ncbi:MAG: choice-of-anchor L domain-containing protein [Phaeodactylibacter sp.]|uniref:choice-of-anchor L domain-containing protein n=1 Tax=Phaeodactylibacter sp. TaxID=1940289 RepID=UPI0032EC653D